MELILIRHAEPEGVGRYLGRRSDPPLSAWGRAQAEALARRLAGEPLAAIYSSPLRRALETAQTIAFPHGLDVRVSDDLAELDFGEWDGLSYEEIQRRDPHRFTRWLSDPSSVCPPGGENFLEMNERVTGFARKIALKHAGELIAVVTHGGPARAVICNALGIPIAAQWRIRQDLAAISRLDFGAGRAVVLNDTCHLAMGPKLGEEANE